MLFKRCFRFSLNFIFTLDTASNTGSGAEGDQMYDAAEDISKMKVRYVLHCYRLSILTCFLTGFIDFDFCRFF